MRKTMQFSFVTGFHGVLYLSAIALLMPAVASAGTFSTTGISKDDASFVEWANACTVTRGYQNIASPTAYATYGTDSNGTGKANGTFVSLGDAGYAIVAFDKAITNGVGNDFAVFENAMGSGTGRFCELAFVEVSSDGVNYFRFPSVSLTQTATQVGGFGAIDPSNIFNLAGKDVAGEGTGFDLSELIGVSSLLNVNNIKYVKVIDIVGSINTVYASHDSLGNIINDPWTTPFASSGFDLDAVGVINAVPEPGTLTMCAAAALAIGGMFWRRWANKLNRETSPEIHQDARPVVLSQNLTILAESKQSIASYADNHNVWRMAAGILLAFVCFAKPATAKRLPLNP